MHLKKIISFLLCASVFCISAGAVNINAGYFGVSDYSVYRQNGWDPHTYADRAGAQYANRLSTALSGKFGTSGLYTQTYRYADNTATRSKFISLANNGAKQNLFVFAGHGDIDGPLLYDAIASKDSLRFKHLYVLMYCCHWLENAGSTSEVTRIKQTFNGTRLQLGFASVMYLDSREGTTFGEYLANQSIIEAYRAAARVYQPQREDGDSVLRVMGYKNAFYDYINSTSTSAPSYSSSPSSFDILVTDTIPRN